MLARMLALLLAFLHLGAAPEGEDPPAEAAEDAATDDTATGAEERDDEDDDDDIESIIGRTSDEASAKVPSKSKRETDLEAELAEARRALEARSTATPSAADPLYEQEERALAEALKAGDKAAYDGLKWATDTNRTLRNNERMAKQALFQSMERDDRAAFRELRDENPKLYARYKDRVESELADLRKKGQNVPRLTLLDYLVGKDIRQGKIKTKAKAKEALPDNVTRIDRGRSPTVRSDVSGKGSGSSTKQKLEKKLENVRI